jgi:hypothetical protein
MKILVLFVQRKEMYEGQCAPEALVCVDEYTNEENPKWFKEACESELKALDENDIAGHAVVEIEVPQDVIRNACLPSRLAIDGKIVS